MNIEAFQLSDHIKVHEVVHFHSPQLWTQYSFEDFDVKTAHWSEEIRYLNNTDDDLSDDIKNLPDNAGGIYIFFIKGSIIPQLETYLVYIGRAQLTENHNLRVRCRKYFYEFFDAANGRPKITRMIGKWGKHLYLRYLEIPDNDQIIRLEAELINAIIPPFNDQIPDKIVKQAIAAF